ncbi:MAG: S41 family peptidase [Candidatus Omnitrophica bacterium]|nr:S41 family peptidase [Candidatus Omnitrophota bacterium]
MRRRWAVCGLIVVMAAAAAWAATAPVGPAGGPGPKRTVKDETYAQLELFGDALGIVQTEYVDDPPPQELIYSAIEGMINALDRHSQFLRPDEYEEMRVETKGQFGGLGVEIGIKEGLLTVVAPIDGTPADAAGLQPGDRIVKIDGQFTRGISLHEAVQKLRGRPGSRVILTILREPEDELTDVILTRAVVKIQSIKEARFLEQKIGYVRITEFQENTAQDLELALGGLGRDGMEALVLDLRRNPGGLLDAAVAVAEKFLVKGKKVVFTRGRRDDQNLEFLSQGAHPHLGFPMVVLVDNGSASASEIVAGALQDHQRAIILGVKTFGKGSVQTVIPLKDGSAVRLTTSKYYTPNGRAIHGEGIIPDVISDERADPGEAKPLDVFERIEQREHPEQPARPKAADRQLRRAVDLLRGVLVYQGRTA